VKLQSVADCRLTAPGNIPQLPVVQIRVEPSPQPAAMREPSGLNLTQ
jgi:hypothetical protein